MEQGLSGGTTNLLRMARTGCQSGSSFVALVLADDSFATAVYPATAEPGAVEVPIVDAVVRQLWHDPGLGRGKALVRTVRVGEDRLAVAAVPLGLDDQGQPSGVLGVLDPGGKSFGVPDLELLSRIAQRLTSYVQARRVVRTQLAHTPAARSTAGPAPGAAGEPFERAVPPAAPSATAAPSTTGAPYATGAPRSGALPLPPFPPPAGTAGVAAAGPARNPIGAPVPAPPDVSSRAAEPSATTEATEGTSLRTPLIEDGEIEGLVSLGTLLGRAGRLFGAGTAMSGSLAVVVVDVEGISRMSPEDVATVARSVRADLRFDDPLARVGDAAFAAVVPLAPGSSTAAQVEAHLASRVRAAMARHQGARVHAAHVVAPLDGGQEADELLRAAVVKLRAR